MQFSKCSGCNSACISFGLQHFSVQTPSTSLNRGRGNRLVGEKVIMNIFKHTFDNYSMGRMGGELGKQDGVAQNSG